MQQLICDYCGEIIEGDLYVTVDLFGNRPLEFHAPRRLAREADECLMSRVVDNVLQTLQKSFALDEHWLLTLLTEDREDRKPLLTLFQTLKIGFREQKAPVRKDEKNELA